MAVAAVAGVIQGGQSHLLGTVIVVLVVLVLTATGGGAVLAWATRLTMTQVAAMGVLFVRALPVVLLTVVVFFNTYAWLMASAISRSRLWLIVMFLLALTIASSSPRPSRESDRCGQRPARPTMTLPDWPAHPSRRYPTHRSTMR